MTRQSTAQATAEYEETLRTNEKEANVSKMLEFGQATPSHKFRVYKPTSCRLQAASCKSIAS